MDETPTQIPAPVTVTPVKRPFWEALAAGVKQVVKVAWTVPAVRSTLVTLLIRFGLPGSLVAVGMAIGDALGK